MPPRIRRVEQKDYQPLLGKKLQVHGYNVDGTKIVRPHVQISFVYTFEDLRDIVYVVFGYFGDLRLISFQHLEMTPKDVQYLEVRGLASRLEERKSQDALIVTAKRLKEDPFKLVDNVLAIMLEELE